MLDIENDFLHAENDEYVLMLLRGKLAELLVKVDTKLNRKCVIASKHGVPMLYDKLTNTFMECCAARCCFARI